MAAPLLAQYIGGGPDSVFGNFMLAFVSAVAFATIVAVVSGGNIDAPKLGAILNGQDPF